MEELPSNTLPEGFEDIALPPIDEEERSLKRGGWMIVRSYSYQATDRSNDDFKVLRAAGFHVDVRRTFGSIRVWAKKQ